MTEYQAIADKLAAAIASRIGSATEGTTTAPQRLAAYCSEIAGVDAEIERFASVVASQIGNRAATFNEIPTPATAPASIGKAGGVLVRVLRDYCINRDALATRFDVAFSTR